MYDPHEEEDYRDYVDFKGEQTIQKISDFASGMILGVAATALVFILVWLKFGGA